MVHLVKKTIKGQVYLYLEECSWQNGKSHRVWQKYLGAEKQLQSGIAFSLTPTLAVTQYDLGLPIALMQIAEKLDLLKIIDRATFKRKQGLSVGQYIAIAALNRCVKPVSKHRLLGWFQSTYLQQFFPKIDTYLDSMAYSNHFEYLTDQAIAKIQADLNERLIQSFGINMNDLVYDATNFFTYMTPDDEDSLPQHGHSKENRDTLNLVGLALLCTQDGGIPLLYDIYPGNLQDARLFKLEFPKILNRLAQMNLNNQDLILTFDKGNNSPEIFDQLDASQINYIVSIRPSMVKDLALIPADTIPRFILPNGKEVGIMEQTRELYGHPRRLLIIYNPVQAKWAGMNLTEKLQHELDTIEEFFHSRLNVKKWRSIEAVRAKMENVIVKSDHWALLTLDLKEEGGKIQYTLQINQSALDQHIATLGKSYLFTNHPSKTGVELVTLFRQQSTIEKAFSYLKSPDILRARPIFHSKDSSIQGHLFTCVIGLLLIMVLTREIHKSYPNFSVTQIMELLASITVSEITFTGSKAPIRQINQLSPEATQLKELLRLDQEL